MNPREFRVGYYTSKYPGWERVKRNQWIDPNFQAEIVLVHKKNNGWPLLRLDGQGSSLRCAGVLHIDEGPAYIDNDAIVEVGNNFNDGQVQTVHNVYTAMTEFEKKPPAEWTLGDNWTFTNIVNKGENVPCLFVKTDGAADAAAPGGGSRRSRRHKRSKRVRKQKKRTRKH